MKRRASIWNWGKGIKAKDMKFVVTGPFPLLPKNARDIQVIKPPKRRR